MSALDFYILGTDVLGNKPAVGDGEDESASDAASDTDAVVIDDAEDPTQEGAEKAVDDAASNEREDAAQGAAPGEPEGEEPPEEGEWEEEEDPFGGEEEDPFAAADGGDGSDPFAGTPAGDTSTAIDPFSGGTPSSPFDPGASTLLPTAPVPPAPAPAPAGAPASLRAESLPGAAVPLHRAAAFAATVRPQASSPSAPPRPSAPSSRDQSVRPGSVQVPSSSPARQGAAAARAPVKLAAAAAAKAGSAPAGGALHAVRGDFTVPTELPGLASDAAWTRFARAVQSASPGAVSPSNALGMFEMKPRRLADLGLMATSSQVRTPSGRMVWVGDFVAPMTKDKFLRDSGAQYRAFADSMRAYVAGMKDGSVPTPDGGRPKGMTLSGALAILHRCGPSGLKTWNDEEKRFSDTVALYERANGIF